jgi:hypothetical protein
LLRGARETHAAARAPRAAAASDAVRQLYVRGAAACAVCLAAARCEGSPWAGLQRVEVEGVVALLHPLRPQQLAGLHREHAHASLHLPAAGGVECIVRTEFWEIGNSRNARRAVAR